MKQRFSAPALWRVLATASLVVGFSLSVAFVVFVVAPWAWLTRRDDVERMKRVRGSTKAICVRFVRWGERLRPVLITVGATVLALIPLAIHGGPLWQPLCYAQIGGLSFATFIELLLVPILYAIFVLDLKIVRWNSGSNSSEGPDRV